jgi:hypothetical protein
MGRLEAFTKEEKGLDGGNPITEAIVTVWPGRCAAR